MTGVVFLGLLEAAEQVKKADAIKRMQNPSLGGEEQVNLFPVGPKPPSTDQTIL